MRRLIREEPSSAAAIWSFRLVLFALAVAAVALAVARWDGVDRMAIAYVLAVAAGIGLIATLLAVLGLAVIWREGRRGVGRAFLALGIGLAILAGPAMLAVIGARLPRLNDVTTDPDQRPDFSRGREALAARGNRVPPDPPAEFRALQLAAYPGLAPIVLERPAEEAFDIARQAARNLGWRIVDTVAPGGRAGTGRFDAVARTTMLRFADDIVVRVRPQAGGARIDMRSASRLGRHDFGANARRIERFSAAVRAIDEER